MNKQDPITYKKLYLELLRQKYRYSKFVAEYLFVIRLDSVNYDEKTRRLNKCIEKDKLLVELIQDIRKRFPEESHEKENQKELDSIIDDIVRNREKYGIK